MGLEPSRPHAGPHPSVTDTGPCGVSSLPICPPSFSETDLCLYPFPPTSFSSSLSPQAGLPEPPLCLSSQLACVYLPLPAPPLLLSYPPSPLPLSCPSLPSTLPPTPGLYLSDYFSLSLSSFLLSPLPSLPPGPLPSGPTPGNAVCPKLLTNPLRLYLNAVSRSEPGLRLRRV